MKYALTALAAFLCISACGTQPKASQTDPCAPQPSVVLDNKLYCCLPLKAIVEGELYHAVSLPDGLECVIKM